ncbi:MAG: phosphate acyltransferase [Candidatus Cloacimonadaceae bacterium]|nr:phosphate acetyltransferase [Candidatus Cloacimonadota bacterium]MCB5258282.1 phosphate acetyltransferase [Candidatus Cloacimonadota bacterium]MDD5625467.1 phosphate acyltransferase [Candidatus Cloacimonadota bacterium]
MKESIRSLEELADYVRSSRRRTRIAVACAEDPNTIASIGKAVNDGFVEGILIGSGLKIKEVCKIEKVDSAIFRIIDIRDEMESVSESIRMVREDEADVLMKGLVGTDKFLKAVLDKEKGLLPEKAIMSYVCAVQLPRYHKLLFISDTAVLPYPDFNQKIAMINYSVAMAQRFGIEKPKVALISATEKVSDNIPHTLEYAELSKMAERGQIKNCIIDGPLDIFLACDPQASVIKGVSSSIAGDADVLIFPSLESANSFYKGLMLFAEGELAGLIQGTIKPVIVMSRSESAASKYYCIALSCLMGGER